MKQSSNTKSVFWVLVKKELSTIFVRRHRKDIDVLSILLNIFLFFVLAFVFVIVLKGLVDNYTVVRFVGAGAQTEAEQLVMRQLELMTLLLDVVALLSIGSGVIRLNKSIDYNSEMEILLRLPITTQQLFLSKLVAFYISNVVLVSGLMIPISITFAIVNAQSVWFYFATVLVCLLLPLFTMAISALLTIPYKYAQNWLKNKYVVLILFFIILLSGAFLIYSKILIVLEGYFVSGQIQFVFNAEVVNAFIGIYNFSYPFNIFARVVLGKDLMLSILYCLLFVGGAVGLIYLVTKKLFSGFILQGAIRSTAFKKKTSCIARSPFNALLRKEFITVFRNPSYAFSYFSTALTLPLMVYCCIGLMTELIYRMLGMNFNFEISLLIILMFAVLTNTFCATNISRDGEAFILNKTLSVSYIKQITTKVLFCSITNVVSILFATIVLLFAKYITVGESVVIFFVTTLLTTGEILMATRKDLNKPKFNLASTHNGESKSTSFVVVIGLLISIVVGAIGIGLSLFLTLSGYQYARAVVYAVMIAIGIAYCVLCGIYLYKGLNKRVYNTVG